MTSPAPARPILPPAESRAGDRQLRTVEDLLTPGELAALRDDLAEMCPARLMARLRREAAQ